MVPTARRKSSVQLPMFTVAIFFWTILTSLGVSVWYFPLWHMGISGYEAMIMATISPILLAPAAIRRLVIRNLRPLHLASLVGLLAFLVKKPRKTVYSQSLLRYLCNVWLGQQLGTPSVEMQLNFKQRPWRGALD